MNNRVVITGMGTVNALGHDVPSTFSAFREGICGIAPLNIRDLDRLMIKIGAQVKDWNPEPHFTSKLLPLLDRVAQFSLVAVRQAIESSGISFDGEMSAKTGVILGNAGGGFDTADDAYYAFYQQGKNRLHPFTVPRIMNNSSVSHITMAYGITGPAFNVSTACASSNHAMGLAFQMVKSGMSRAMITGGCESMLSAGGIKVWEGLRVMSHDACRPFSAGRTGMVQGEGAAAFIFEDYEHARARGADILCEVKGFSMSSDASDIVMPNVDGATNTMVQALKNANIPADSVDYINAHGTGTLANDSVESAAIYRVFGANPPPVSATKSMHGHLIGGTGAVELLACIMAIKDSVIAPTIGYQAYDPDCVKDVVANHAREAQVSTVITNAFAFGGLNASIVLTKV